MLKDLFSKRRKYATIPSEHAKKEIPEGIMVKCKNCSLITYTKELNKNNKVCPKCGYHNPLKASERIKLLVDEGSFEEINQDIISEDILSFPEYAKKLEQTREKTGANDAIVTGKAKIKGHPVVLGVMDFSFMGGSMGSVVGEKITRAILAAVEQQSPFILFSTSGGARMQEGLFSLMQMAKTSAALAQLDRKGLLYISVLTHPTTGGVSASFASLGDYNIAEPGALIGFAGPRVIEQTIRQKLPEGFQTAEFLLEHGQLDMVVERKDMRERLATILDIHAG